MNPLCGCAQSQVVSFPAAFMAFYSAMGASLVAQWERATCVPADAGDTGSTPGSGRCPGEGSGNPLQYSCLGNHGQRSLLGYSPWGPKELMTK